MAQKGLVLDRVPSEPVNVFAMQERAAFGRGDVDSSGKPAANPYNTGGNSYGVTKTPLVLGAQKEPGSMEDAMEPRDYTIDHEKAEFYDLVGDKVSSREIDELTMSVSGLGKRIAQVRLRRHLTKATEEYEKLKTGKKKNAYNIITPSAGWDGLHKSSNSRAPNGFLRRLRAYKLQRIANKKWNNNAAIARYEQQLASTITPKTDRKGNPKYERTLIGTKKKSPDGQPIQKTKQKFRNGYERKLNRKVNMRKRRGRMLDRSYNVRSHVKRPTQRRDRHLEVAEELKKKVRS